MQVGDEVEVTLPETATTGFRWAVEVDDDTLRPTGDAITAPTEPRGAPGSRTFTFEAIRPGRSLLRLVKQRSWETEPRDEFRVEIDVATEDQ